MVYLGIGLFISILFTIESFIRRDLRLDGKWFFAPEFCLTIYIWPILLYLGYLDWHDYKEKKYGNRISSLDN